LAAGVIARGFMLEEISDAVLDKVKHFTVGFGRAGETPAAKGSGVLIKHAMLWKPQLCLVNTVLGRKRLSL
jgi:hypothetical protein